VKSNTNQANHINHMSWPIIAIAQIPKIRARFGRTVWSVCVGII